MKNDIEDLKSLLDTYAIQNAFNTIQLQTLQNAFFELSDYLLDKDEAKNLKSHYFHTLNEQNNALSPDLLELYTPARFHFALFELNARIQMKIQELEE